jgi:methionyl-tRNA formyltransferase|tara:strand:- start:2470 stop:3141 length:672 start_codon:yes stop_codon:yes gene_type:complete
MKYSILFLGRKSCIYTSKLERYLKNFSHKLISIKSKKIGEKINPKRIKKNNFDYVICFRSFFLLKNKLLNKTKIASINFHPGPPNYRGIGCINFALFNGEKKFGTTAHLIDDKIDHGSILDIRYFKFNKSDNLKKCLEKTHKNMFLQTKKVLNYLFKNAKNLKKLANKNKDKKWSKKLYKKKDLDNLYKTKKRMNRKQLERLKRATIYKNFKPNILQYKNRIN